MADSTLAALTADTNPTTTSILYLVEDPGGAPLNRKITSANLLNVINNLTADATPDRSADYVATYDASASGPKKVLLQNVGGFNMSAETSNSSPADATTYFWGSMGSAALTTTATLRKITIPRAGVIRRIELVGMVTGAGSAETSTMSFRLNNTTDTTITSSYVVNTSPVAFSNSALSITVAAGDFFEIKWVTPTWATNPTGVYIRADIWIA